MKSVKLSFSLILISFGIFASSSQSQAVTHYNLADLVKNGQVVTVPAYETQQLVGIKKDAVTTKGIIWLKGVSFTEGTVDIDLRGKDVFLSSFLGIAFHGTDTTHCDILYFRPFNFKHSDTTRRKWAVAYMSLPDYDYAVLRKNHPLVYENAVTPVPDPADWFHATIVIKKRRLSVYVNHSVKASLETTLIGDRESGLFGLYSDGLTNDFADLTIAQPQ